MASRGIDQPRRAIAGSNDAGQANWSHERRSSVKPSDRVPFYVLRLFEEVLVYLLEDERLLDGHSAVVLDHERS